MIDVTHDGDDRRAWLTVSTLGLGLLAQLDLFFEADFHCFNPDPLGDL